MRRIYSLAASLLILVLGACQPISALSLPTIEPSETAIALPGTATAQPTIAPSQSFTPVPITSTFTTLPATPSATVTITPQPTAAPVVFAAIGDYGSADQSEANVAELVLSWKPDFIITLGDNNYPVGSAETIDAAIGQFFHSYIYPYKGEFGPGAEVNRFFPCLGNHDVQTRGGKPYFDYFSLPGNQRYYDFTWGPVHLFALDDLDSEPDGVGASSIQAEWLKAGLAASDSAWNIVYMHYPPYSSGLHGSTDWARWPYKEWGADAVLAGHDHTYERLNVGGLTYLVNGLGGGGIYYFTNPLPGSEVRYNAGYGAMRIEATGSFLKFEFITTGGEVVDTYELVK